MQQRPSPTQNGRVYDWASLSVVVTIHDGPQIDLSGVSAISLECGQEVARARGIGGKYLGRTGGRPTDPTASFTFYKAEHGAFMSSLAAVAEAQGMVRDDGAIVVGDVSFDCTYSCSMHGTPDIEQFMLKGMSVLSQSASFSEGTDPLAVEVPFFVAEVLYRPRQSAAWQVIK